MSAGREAASRRRRTAGTSQNARRTIANEPRAKTGINGSIKNRSRARSEGRRRREKQRRAEPSAEKDPGAEASPSLGRGREPAPVGGARENPPDGDAGSQVGAENDQSDGPGNDGNHRVSTASGDRCIYNYYDKQGNRPRGFTGRNSVAGVGGPPRCPSSRFRRSPGW